MFALLDHSSSVTYRHKICSDHRSRGGHWGDSRRASTSLHLSILSVLCAQCFLAPERVCSGKWMPRGAFMAKLANYSSCLLPVSIALSPHFTRASTRLFPLFFLHPPAEPERAWVCEAPARGCFHCPEEGHQRQVGREAQGRRCIAGLRGLQGARLHPLLQVGALHCIRRNGWELLASSGNAGAQLLVVRPADCGSGISGWLVDWLMGLLWHVSLLLLAGLWE